MNEVTIQITLLITCLLYLVYEASTPTCLHLEGHDNEGSYFHLRFYDRSIKIFFLMYFYSGMRNFNNLDPEGRQAVIDFLIAHTKFMEYDVKKIAEHDTNA